MSTEVRVIGVITDHELGAQLRFELTQEGEDAGFWRPDLLVDLRAGDVRPFPGDWVTSVETTAALDNAWLRVLDGPLGPER